MTSPFDLPSVFQLATFIFDKPVFVSGVNERGNPVITTDKVPVTFKLKPLKQTPSRTNESQGTAAVGERYEARLVKPMKFPIIPGTSVQGVFNSRPCAMTIDSVAQSAVSPILTKALGEQYLVTIRYRVGMGDTNG